MNKPIKHKIADKKKLINLFLWIFIVFDAVSKKDSNINHNAEVIEK